VLALILVAVSVGMSNAAAAIGIGAGGVDARVRLRIGLVFGAFESGMPVIGLLIGGQFASQLGHAGRWVGAALLVGVGVYAVVSSWRGNEGAVTRSLSGTRLLLAGLALSLDNLVVGFALGTYRVPILAGALLIGAVSVAMSLIGLELGDRLARVTGRRSEQVGGVILISVGVAIAASAIG
jgi:manganese efflux pump family protein